MARPSGESPVPPVRVIAPLVLAAFAYATAQTTIVPVVPYVQETTASSPSQVAWLVTGFFVSSAGLTVLAGRLGDLFGRKRVLCAVLVVFVVGAVLAALGESLAPIVAGRVVMGAAGGVFPLAYAILGAHLPRDRAALGTGMISSMFGVGGALGLPLGGLVAGSFGHRGLFGATAAVALLSLLAVVLLVPSDRGGRAGGVDWLGAVLLSAALGGPLVAVSRAEEWGWTGPWTLGLLAAGAAAFTLLLAVESRVAQPLVNLGVMRQRDVWAANLVTFLVSAGQGTLFFLIPQAVQLPEASGVGLGVGVDRAGLFLMPGAVLVIVAGPVTGRIVARFGTRLPLALSAVAGAFGLGLLAVGGGTPALLVVGGAVVGLAGGVTYSALPVLIADAVSLDQLGGANGVNTIVRHVSMAVVAQIAAAVLVLGTPTGVPYPQEWAFTLSYGAAAALTAAALIPLWLLRLRRSRGSDGSLRERPTAVGEPAASPTP
ncbi:MFS transporter [Thermobifida halotolerans]|uniref:MFS transporter n=1 Tax=Thermobifida halotolerans TaxID=483545 RepID=A0AA97LU13_9ACTN|nr:MFS transporter [Thermobifida halotolerans]UOE18042.1 MFS transporter [Thermobifida halotolerans]